MDNSLIPKINDEEVPTVSELNAKIKTILEPNLKQLWVRGEISNLRVQSSGHIYFTIKDRHSQISCVFFNRYAINSDVGLEDGNEIVIFGNISVYEPYGKYQINVKHVQAIGIGNLHIIFEKLKRKLKKEGLFDLSHKKEIPSVPKRIALITSPTGAAIKDFLKVLKRRNFSCEIDLYPVKVQGNGALEDIIKALEYIKKAEKYDFVILTRGGGSIEDLWTFNEETLARYLFNFNIPSISAIGHEIDVVLTDLVADYRAETPSAAAELISSKYILAKDRYNNNLNKFKRLINESLKDKSKRIETANKYLKLSTPQKLIDKMILKIDIIDQKISYYSINLLKQKTQLLNRNTQNLHSLNPVHSLGSNKLKLKYNSSKLKQHKLNYFKQKNNLLNQYKIRLKNTSIESNLKRGYSLIKNNSNFIVESLVSAKDEKSLKICFFDGEMFVKRS